jgi:hypothetical protein
MHAVPEHHRLCWVAVHLWGSLAEEAAIICQPVRWAGRHRRALNPQGVVNAQNC